MGEKPHDAGPGRQDAVRFASVALLLFLQARHLLPIVKMVVFGQATGAIHVSIVDLILPETPCFPFEAFQVKRFLQTLRTNAFLDLSCDSDRMLDLLSSVLKNSQSFGILEFRGGIDSSEIGRF